jgi:peptidoglycan/xylan/chitin deacetylase (PgdA/CDA1 family)
MNKNYFADIAFLFALSLHGKPIEIHDTIHSVRDLAPRVALTLDACSGHYDGALIEFLILNRIPATLFLTEKWIDQNSAGVGVIKAHLDLFDIEDHGANHIPAVIGPGKRVFGIAGEPDELHLRNEVIGGAQAIFIAFGVVPKWYRAATGEYDREAIGDINKLGYKIAGFSVNADAGATLNASQIQRKFHDVKDGDVILAHMNKPSSESAKGLSFGLLGLLSRGFRFVRLDEVELQLEQPAARAH